MVMQLLNCGLRLRKKIMAPSPCLTARWGLPIAPSRHRTSLSLPLKRTLLTIPAFSVPSRSLPASCSSLVNISTFKPRIRAKKEGKELDV